MPRCKPSVFSLRPLLCCLPLLAPSLSSAQIGVKGWPTYGGNPQHTAQSPVPTQRMKRIRWSSPVDLNPQYSGNSLLIHYGSPLITPNNTIIFPVKTGASDGFKIEGRRAYDGSLLWTQTTDYSIPSQNWIPSCSPTLLMGNKVAYPGAGGTVYIRTSGDAASSTVTQYCFYGLSGYQANKAAMDAAVKICTPLTADNQGNIFFGYIASGNPLGVQAGIAKISSQGAGSWAPASVAAANANATRPIFNCAPAISNDGTEVYMSFTGSTLAGMSTANLANMHTVVVLDPKTGNAANFFDEGTSSPTIAPDNDVYYGGLDNPFTYTHDRGYLYHFTRDLVPKNYVGAFGWDDTCSIVPKSMVPSYQGSSAYLVFTKYNDYIGFGDGMNKIAVLDPNDVQFDTIDQTNTMKEVLVKVGPTPELSGGVREWCINSGAVDVAGKAIIANCEDGKCYRWNLVTNTLEDAMTLTSGIGEAYTPTVTGPDGTCYAINNALLFALGDNSVLPMTFQVPRGALTSGALFDATYDDKYVVKTKASTQLSLNDPALQIVVTGTSFDKLPSPTASLSFDIKLTMVNGDVTQVIDLFNYVTGTYETVSTLTGGNALTRTTVTVSSNAKRFVDQTTKAIKAKITYRSSVFPVAKPVEAVINRLQWTINP